MARTSLHRFGIVALVTAFNLMRCPSQSHAAQPAQPQPASDQPISLSGQLELARLLDLAADRLKLTIEYDPAIVKGAVTLRSANPLSSEELWQFANRVLVARGFVTVQQGPRAYAVMKLGETQPSAPQIPDPENRDGPQAGFSSILVRVQSRPPKEVAEALKTVLSKPSGSVTELGTQGLLLVSDLSSRLEQVERMVALIDTPSAGVKIEELHLDTISAAMAIETVSKLAERTGAVRGRKLQGELVAGGEDSTLLLLAPESEVAMWKDLVARVDHRAGLETRTYTPKVFGVTDVSKLIEQTLGVGSKASGATPGSFRMVVDELTGSLVVTGSAQQQRQVQELIERLDATPAGSSPMRAFHIKNRPVQEIVSTLSQLLNSGGDGTVVETEGPSRSPLLPVPTGSRAPDSVRDPAAATPSAPAGDIGKSAPPHKGNARRLTLTADEPTNTLIAIGEPRLLAQIDSMLALLDVRQPQVMLEVMLISLTDSDAMNLGVELERIGSLDGSAVKLSSLFGLSSPAATGLTPTSGQGFTGSILNPGDFSVILKALQNINKGQTSSMPKLLVKNNERATFSSVLQQPVATTVSSNTSTTTSFGGTEDAGTTVTVQPQIAHGDHLSLTYDLKLSSFVGAATGPGLPPPKQQNTITSVAMIPDGHVVVVGGIELVSDSNGVSQIPLVGDIPVLGEAFKSRTKSVARTRFYTFIRATVMRNAGFEDLKYLSAKDQHSVGIDDGFPRVAPRIIRYASPSQVLAPSSPPAGRKPLEALPPSR